jgi:tetratricopeptide (TPR) repeat protein
VKRAVAVAAILIIGLAAAYGYGVTRRETDYRAFIAQGDAALAAGDTSAAIEAFSGAIAYNDESMVAYLRRGEAKRRRDELEPALKDLRRATELDPTATRPRELLGDVNYAMGRYTRAAERYQEYLALDDQSPRLLYKLGLARYRAGEVAAAIDALRNAVTLDNQFAEAHYLMGLCFREARQRKEAIAALERAVELAPTMIKAREELAEIYEGVGRIDDRTSQLERLLAFDPGPAREVALGLAYAAQGDTTSAVQTLSRTARRHPSYRETYVALGKVWLDIALARSDEVALGKALEALQTIAGVIDSSEALTLLGRALLISNQDEVAETTLQRASETLPVDPNAFVYLAEVAERRGHHDLARQALLDYHALESQRVDSRRHGRLASRIADLSLRLNDANTAITWYHRAALAGPLDAVSLTGLADAQFRSGQVDDARATLNKALTADPALPAALQLKRRLTQAQSRSTPNSQVPIPN